MASALAELQHCLTIDARYAPLRLQDAAFRTLYLRRRRHLLSGATRSREYLQLRTHLLKVQFGNTGQGSIRSSATSNQQDSSFNQTFRSQSRTGAPSMSSIISDTASIGKHSVSHISPSPNSSSTPNRPPPPPSSYTFHGVFHIFDDHNEKVTRLFFLNDDKSRLATASADGRVVIRQVLPGPPSTVAVLRHNCGVIDMDCSETNELLVTAAQDATVRLWSLSQAQCMRSITLSSPHIPTVVRFLPINNNFIMVGTSKQIVQLINVSTGRSVKRGIAKIHGKALSVCFQRDPKTFWVGDDTGAIYSFICDMAVSSLTRTSRLMVAEGFPVHSLGCRILPSFKKPPSSSKSHWSSVDCLLLVGAGSSLWLFTISSQSTYSSGASLSPLHQIGASNVPRPICQMPVRLSGHAVFAPLLTSSRWLVLAAGSSDQTGENVVSILAIDSASAVPDLVFQAGTPQVLTALPGHAATITCTHFAYDETLLASADSSGTVIVWRR